MGFMFLFQIILVTVIVIIVVKVFKSIYSIIGGSETIRNGFKACESAIADEQKKEAQMEEGYAASSSSQSVRIGGYAQARPVKKAEQKGNRSVSSGGAGEISTTEYLSRKAQEDAREHAQEELKERRQARKDLGGRREGLKLLPGDPVPQGMVKAVCPYCGAENLVPYGSRDQFGCYFCREELRI